MTSTFIESISNADLSGQRIVIVGTFAFIKGIYDEARLLGLKIFSLALRRQADDALQADDVFVTDFLANEEYLDVLSAIHEKTPFAGVISFFEYGLVPAAKIAARLGLRSLPLDVIERTRDKAMMRKHLSSHHFSPVEWAHGKCRDDLVRFGQTFGYPFVIKPTSGVGSQDVVLIGDSACAASVNLPNAEFMLEEFLDGPEFSIDSYSRNGEVCFFGVNQELKDHSRSAPFLELGHKYPAALDPGVIDDVYSFIREFLNLMGLTDGPAHTEFKQTKGGLRIIETHNRLGGDEIPELIQRTTGCNLVRLALLWATRGDNFPLCSVAPSTGAAIMYFTPPAGTVRSVSGLEAMARTPNVIRISSNLRWGVTLEEASWSLNRSGYVLAVGRDSQEAETICRTVLGLVLTDVS